MPTEIQLDSRVLLAFLLVLARVSGVIAFVPFPGLRNTPDLARITFALTLTWCLRPAWPAVSGPMPGVATLALWMIAEATLGIVFGLLVGLLLESFQMGAQIIAIQAGYSYASTIDPNTQADTGVIAIVVQLIAGFCFFVAGLDREILSALARSFERIPPGAYVTGPQTVETLLHAGSRMLAAGVRIAMPVIAFLLLVDLALALVGRIQSQLQLLSLAFPAKMLASLFLLASLASLFPSVFESTARATVAAMGKVLGG